MTNAALEMFRSIANEMIGKADWQWIGPHMSQRMFGISRERAEEYARRHGGTAKPLEQVYYVDANGEPSSAERGELPQSEDI